MLDDICKQIDEYCKNNNKNIIMSLVQIDSNGNTESIVLHRVANPIPALGMIEMLLKIIKTEKKDLKNYILNEGSKTESHEVPEILSLIKRFEELKDEGERVKDTDPTRLIEILKELKVLVNKIRSLKSNNQDSEKKDNSNDALDDFKNMF